MRMGCGVVLMSISGDRYDNIITLQGFFRAGCSHAFSHPLLQTLGDGYEILLCQDTHRGNIISPTACSHYLENAIGIPFQTEVIQVIVS